MDDIKPGRYVVAVSGGVDSMVLLDMLRQRPELQLIVAHANHGIREDAQQDQALVKQCCKTHGLIFVTAALNLGAGTSEDKARRARYDFLRHCCKTQRANGIITAHHQDDVLETALIAIMRGTGWRGLAPFVRTSDILRPLLPLPKWQLVAYARKHNIAWYEDSTNADESYLRNYIRRSLIPMLDQKSDTWRQVFLQHIRKQQELRTELEESLDSLCDKNNVISRYQLIMLPPLVAYELLQQTFRRTLGNSVERPLADAALLFAKTARPHKVMELSKSWQLRATIRDLIVEPRTP